MAAAAAGSDINCYCWANKSHWQIQIHLPTSQIYICAISGIGYRVCLHVIQDKVAQLRR